MITFMLDTNICIYIVKKKPQQVLEGLKNARICDTGISAITLSELGYGAAKSSQPDQNRIALAEFLAPLAILSYEDMAAQECGKIRISLERQGTPVGSMDILIAAHALSLNCILVTNNEDEFSRISFLKIENWAK